MSDLCLIQLTSVDTAAEGELRDVQREIETAPPDVAAR